MKFIWRWLRKNIVEEYSDSPEPSIAIGKHSTVRANDAFEGDGGLTIRVHKANGGRIVAFNHYDRKTDRDYRSVYIVTDEQDFEKELGKMITLESMRG